MSLARNRGNLRGPRIVARKPTGKTTTTDRSQRWVALGTIGLAVATAATAAVSVFAVLRSDAANRAQQQLAREQQQTVERGQITDRFTKANDQLASVQIQSRLGGIYALEQIMKDAPDYEDFIIEILCAYIRTAAPLGSPADETKVEADPLAADIQGSLTVLGRRPAPLLHRRLNLSHTKLSGADLSNMNLVEADLTGSDLRSARVGQAELSRARLSDANLTKAYLSGSNLDGASLTGAELSGANLSYVNLNGANVSYASLVGTIMSRVYLTGALAISADLTRADLSSANLRGVNLTNANLSSADLSGADFRDANLTGVNLTGVRTNGETVLVVGAAASPSASPS